MGRSANRLTVRGVQTATDPGHHADGGGLFLNVASGGSKSWMFVYRSPVHRMPRKGKMIGKTRKMGLGSVTLVTLAAARDRAHALRKVLEAGTDPLDAPDPAEPPMPPPTFGEVADDVVSSLKAGWKNEKHKAQWEMTLKEYARPLRGMAVDAIATEDVLGVLKPISRRPRRPAGSVAASKRCSTPLRPKDIVPATIPHAGAVISTTSCRLATSCNAATTPRCPTVPCRPSSRSCALWRPSARAPWSSPF